MILDLPDPRPAMTPGRAYRRLDPAVCTFCARNSAPAVLAPIPDLYAVRTDGVTDAGQILTYCEDHYAASWTAWGAPGHPFPGAVSA